MNQALAGTLVYSRPELYITSAVTILGCCEAVGPLVHQAL
jgi:hypothetical protein